MKSNVARREQPDAGLAAETRLMSSQAEGEDEQVATKNADPGTGLRPCPLQAEGDLETMKPISTERPRFGMPGQLCRLLDPKDHVAHTSRKRRPARNRKRVLIYAGWDYLILYVRSPSAALNDSIFSPSSFPKMLMTPRTLCA